MAHDANMNSAETSVTPRKLGLIASFVLVVAACGGGSDVGAFDAGNASAQTEAPVPTTTSRPDDMVVDDTPEVEPSEVADEAPRDGETSSGDEGAHDEGGDEATHDEEAEPSDGTVADGDRVVEISMTEMAFTPEVVHVVAGETITFRVSNEGLIAHEFRLSNAHRVEEHLASGHDDHHDSDGHHGEADVVLHVEAGDVGEVTVSFPEDVTFFTEVACLIPGHYEAGMKGTIEYS